MKQAKQFRKRSAILACLRQSDAHPSAEMVYEQLKPAFPDLSLGTVYRNLAMFRQQGQIGSIGTVDGTERFDGHLQPHVHFICTACSRVMDVPETELPAALQDRVEKSLGGRIDSCQLTFRGVCRQCLENAGQKA